MDAPNPPYALFHDTRDDKTYRVAADGQSKVETSGNALLIDKINLQNNGFASTTLEAGEEYTQAWLDSVPTRP